MCNDLLALFHSFYNNNLDISRLNLAYISLIPKKEGASESKYFRLISLLNSPYKIIAKVLSNHLRLILDQLVDSSQTTFVKQRSTIDSVATVEELIIACSKYKWIGLFLKLDF